jgi:hypothetical protein
MTEQYSRLNSLICLNVFELSVAPLTVKERFYVVRVRGVMYSLREWLAKWVEAGWPIALLANEVL